MIEEQNSAETNECLPLQNFIFSFERIKYDTLWGHSSIPVTLKVNGLECLSDYNEETLSFDSLANTFPAGYFYTYTNIRNVFLKSFISADEALLTIYHTDQNSKKNIIHQEKYKSKTGIWHSPTFSLNSESSHLSFEIKFKDHIKIENTSWLGVSKHSNKQLSALLSITAFKRDDYVIPFVEDLCRYQPLKLFDITFLVVDNGLTLKKEFLSDDIRVKFIPQKNLGCTSGFMRGLVEARSQAKDLMIIADDDIVMPPEILYRMVVFQAVSVKPLAVGAGMIIVRQPNILWEQGGIVLSKGVNSLKTINKGVNINSATDRSKAYTDRNPDYTALWLMSAPTKFFSFLPSLFIYYEDILQCLLLGKKGVDVVVPPHIFLWHATLEKQGAMWKRYLWLRNDLATRFLIDEKLAPLKIGLSFVNLIMKILASFDYKLAEFHLKAFEEAISGSKWTTDPIGENQFVQSLIHENPKMFDYSDQLSERFLNNDFERKSFINKILIRLVYICSLGNYIYPFARVSDEKGKLAFRYHGDYEGWGWIGFKRLAVIDKKGEGYLCERSWKKMFPILGKSILLGFKILYKSKYLKISYKESFSKYENSWLNAFKKIEP